MIAIILWIFILVGFYLFVYFAQKTKDKQIKKEEEYKAQLKKYHDDLERKIRQEMNNY